MRILAAAMSALAIVVNTAAHAGRTLVNEADIDAPPGEVWKAWTTEEGFTSWAVAKAKIDLRVGGDIVTSYMKDSTLDDDSTIINRILSFEPQRMLSIQNIRAPKAFPNAELFQGTWTVMYLSPLPENRTHVRIVGMGYGEGPEWDDLYEKFKAGNAYTLSKLQQKFATGEETGGKKAADDIQIDAQSIIADTAADQQHIADAEQVMAVMDKLIGGYWIHTGSKPDGSPFLVRNMLARGPDGVSIVGEGWLGDNSGMAPHQATQIFRVAGKTPDQPQRVRFNAVDEHGSVSQGDIVLVNPNTVQWNWNLGTLGGQTARFRVLMSFPDDQHYRMTMAIQGDDNEWKQMIDIVMERVAELPEPFTKMRPAAQ